MHQHQDQHLVAYAPPDREPEGGEDGAVLGKGVSSVLIIGLLNREKVVTTVVMDVLGTDGTGVVIGVLKVL